MIARGGPNGLSARLIRWSCDVVIENENGLWIFIPIMTALALIGLVLAAHYEEGVYHYAGFSLFVVSVLSIFGGLKSYYDAKERRQHQH
jgi:hypothetical protein